MDTLDNMVHQTVPLSHDICCRRLHFTEGNVINMFSISTVIVCTRTFIVHTGGSYLSTDRLFLTTLFVHCFHPLHDIVLFPG